MYRCRTIIRLRYPWIKTVAIKVAVEKTFLVEKFWPILISNVEKVTFHLFITIFRQIFDAFEKDSHLCRRFTVFVTKYNLMSKVSASLQILIAKSKWWIKASDNCLYFLLSTLILSLLPRRLVYWHWQCCGSVTFWCGFAPLTYGPGFGSGSCSFRQWPSRLKKKKILGFWRFFKAHLHNALNIKVIKKSQKNRNQGFFAWW